MWEPPGRGLSNGREDLVAKILIVLTRTVIGAAPLPIRQRFSVEEAP